MAVQSRSHVGFLYSSGIHRFCPEPLRYPDPKIRVIEERILLRERLQARQILRESETELSKNIYERGVDDRGFGRIRSALLERGIQDE